MSAVSSTSQLLLTQLSLTVANQDRTLIDTPSSEPPVLKGYLNKYTNVARGYGTRWFVLKNGVLSCESYLFTMPRNVFMVDLDYRHQEDENVASRGSIAMKTARLKVAPAGEKMRFEVQSTPTRGHQSSGIQKWYMKANHPVEASRWTQAISKSIEWCKREGAEIDKRRTSEESQSSLVKTHSQQSHRGSISTLARRRHESAAAPGGSTTSFVDTGDEDGNTSPTGHDSPDHLRGVGDEDEERADDSSTAESTGHVPPYDTSFDLHGNSTAAQMELTSQLLSNLTLPTNAPSSTQELKTALKESFLMVQGMVNDYVQMSKERDEWWKLKVRREQERQAVWEESLQTVVKEGEALEKELRTRSRKRGSRFFDLSASEAGGTLRQKALTMSHASVPEEASKGYFPDASIITSSSPISTRANDSQVVIVTPTAQMASPSILTPTQTQQRRQPSMPSPSVRDQADNSTIDTDEEDEFYDAIEADNLPNLEVHELLASPTHSEIHLPSIDYEAYAGYKTLRDRLPITEDNRPSTSLWSVLKHSIGKDLTKISFPVFFNEPTSMLQRMVSVHWIL